MKSNNEKLTSVKVDKTLFDRFKIECYENNISLKQLVNKSIFLYLNDNDFKTKIKSVK